MDDTLPLSYIRDNMRGAPVINGNTPGCLIAALDALLVTGWGAASPTSVVVASGVATATFASTTPWTVGTVIEVSGGTPSSINGKARVATSDGNTLTWATSAPDGAYTGTISIKYAAAGWEKVFSDGTTKAVYRSTDVTSSRFCLRVDDSGTRSARVCGYESMSDVNTGVGPFPTNAQISGGGYWHKSYQANATAAPYLFAASSKTLLVALSPAVSDTAAARQANVRGFGDPVPLNPSGDAYACFLSARGADLAGGMDTGALDGSTANSSAAGFTVAARARSAALGAEWQRPVPESGRLDQMSGDCDYFGAAPSAIDGQIKHCRMLLKDQTLTNEPPRALVPGVRYIPQKGARSVLSTPFGLLDGAGDLAGRQLAAIYTDVSGYAVGSSLGASLIDLTGPWG